MNTKKCFSFILVLIVIFIGMFVFQFNGNSEPKQKEKIAFNDEYSDSLKFSTTADAEDQDEEFESIQRKRKAWMIEACKHVSSSKRLTKTLLKHLLVNDKHQVLFCYIPKVACTTWKGLFIELSGKSSHSGKLSPSYIHKTNRILRTLSRYSPKSIGARLHNYKSVVFVREPFERLLSAYLNKFTEPETNMDFHLRYGRKIIETFRVNASENSLRKGDDVTFPEFVKFLLTQGKDNVHINEHWDQFFSLCNPCYMNYDFIGKFETIATDADMILQKLGIKNVVEFPSRSSKTASLMESYYSQVDKDDLKQLWRNYEKDYFLWDYPKPSFIDTS